MAAASAAPPRRKARRSRRPFPATTSSSSRPRLDRLLGFVSIVVLLGHGRIIYFSQGWLVDCSLRSARFVYFPSGPGRSWNFTTLGFVPLPPSRWKGVRLPKVDHTPLPFQPAFGSSI